MGKMKLNFRFHNPNTDEATADLLIKVLMESHKIRVEQAIHAASQQQIQQEECSVSV